MIFTLDRFYGTGIKGIKPQGKPWTRILNGMTPPQADGVMNLPAASCRELSS
jgi:hypothetical protein